MSTDNNVKTVTASGEIKETSGTVSALVIPKDTFAVIKKTAAGLDKMETGISLAPRYFEFEAPGDSVRGVFVGFKNLTLSDRETTAVLWMDKDMNVFLNSGVNLVDTFQGVGLEIGAPVEITYVEKKKVERGSVKVYDVRILQ